MVKRRQKQGLDPENYAEVRLWGHVVGALMHDRDTGAYRFGYDDAWKQQGLDIAPLMMPIKGLRDVYEFPSLNPETFRGLPGCFADILPDDFGNAVINAWLARQGRDPSTFSAVERLLYTGNRGMGALEFLPVIEREQLDGGASLELDTLIKTAQKVLDEREDAGGPVAPNNNHGIHSIFQVGSSAGGARPKAVVAINKDRTDIRSGQVDAPPGYEHYLIKFDGVVEHRSASEIFGDPKGFGLMEYTYHQMATRAGITMEPSEIMVDGSRAHFLTRRFDRRGNEKVHAQTLCAMFHADYKRPGQFSYEELFQVVRRLRLSRGEAVELYRRMVFNVVARNQDDHTKNVSFVMDREGQWTLSPAYDLAYSYKPGSLWVEQHNMSINGKRSGFTREDLLAVSSQISNFNSEAKSIIQEVTEAVAQWRVLAKANDVPGPLIDEIERNLRLNLA